MEPQVAALAEQHAELWGLISGLGETEFALVSRCEGWTIADVILHLAQTDQLALASLRGRFGDALSDLTAGAGPAATIDEGADRMVAGQRGAGGDLIRRRWRVGADRLRAELLACDGHRRVVWVAGQLSAQTLAATRLAEAWIHTGDIAAALNMPLTPTARLRHICRLAWRTLPYAFARAGRELSGAVAFELRGPDGEVWQFEPDGQPATIIRGDAEALCLVAARRRPASATGLTGEGPDAAAVLELVRTYA